MKKFVLIHVYSDFNKGDAGIIISTVQNLRKYYPGCKIDMISTFSSRDDTFNREHKEIRKYADNLYSSIFPELFLKIGSKCYYSTLSKLIAMFGYSFKAVVNYLSIKLFKLPVLVHSEEMLAFNAIKNCDVVISKGGSFLCSHGTLREDYSLMKLLYPFYVAKAFKKKTIVLAQSLGPFESKLSQAVFKKSLTQIDKIYFREHRSKELIKQNNIVISEEKVYFCPDTAFSLDSSQGVIIANIDEDKFNVGLTIVDHQFKNELARSNYKTSIKMAMKFLKEKYNANFYIFPQVINSTAFGDADIKLAKIIYSELDEDLKIFVQLVEGNFESIDLARTYSKLDFFIATRLHSSIFAISQNVPIVNISYHGTKSEGTFELFDYMSNVIRISSVSPEELIAKISNIIEQGDIVKKDLASKLILIKADIKKAFMSIE